MSTQPEQSNAIHLAKQFGITAGIALIVTAYGFYAGSGYVILGMFGLFCLIGCTAIVIGLVLMDRAAKREQHVRNQFFPKGDQ